MERRSLKGKKWDSMKNILKGVDIKNNSYYRECSTAIMPILVKKYLK